MSGETNPCIVYLRQRESDRRGNALALDQQTAVEADTSNWPSSLMNIPSARPRLCSCFRKANELSVCHGPCGKMIDQALFGTKMFGMQL